MFAIDDPTAAATLPVPEAAGTPGFWTEGNPGTGVPATYVRASFLNMLQSELLNILLAAGVTPSKTTYNQVLTSIKALVGPGRLLNIQTFTSSGTYIPTSGTTRIRVRLQAPGGGAGGAPATTSGQVSIGAGGGGGSYSEGHYTSGFSGGVTVTIGAKGTGGTGAAGATGGNCSFGALLTAVGGPGGGIAGPSAPPFSSVGTAGASPGTGGYLMAQGGSTPVAFGIATGSFNGSAGGSSTLSGGAGAVANGAAGANAVGYGGGGGGTGTGGVSSALKGGDGAPGILIIEEYA